MPATRAPNVLVVGAGGAVGRLLARPWAAMGAPVILTSRAGLQAAGLAAVRWTPGTPLPALPPIAAMIVLAGTTPRSGGDLALSPAIARACRAAAQGLGVGRVLHASTAAVYGFRTAAPLEAAWSEDEVPQPGTDYGRARLLAEGVWADSPIPATALRIGNVAGADALLAGRLPPPAAPVALDTFADGATPMRSYIGPQTLARVLMALAQHPGPLPPVLNIAAPQPVSMGDLARAAGLRWHPRPRPEAPDRALVLDTTLLQGLVPLPACGAEPGAIVAEARAALGLA